MAGSTAMCECQGNTDNLVWKHGIFKDLFCD